jgi:phosphoglycolate phosphatase
MSRRLILFDIDGTILSSMGAAARAFRQALQQVFGTAGPTSGYSFGGRTDPQIAFDLLTMAGFAPEQITDDLPRALQLYLGLLEDEFTRTPPTVYPGVRELLQRLSAEPELSVVGLLTGNVEEGAHLKLSVAGIDPGQFRVGAFGSDNADRRELPAIAIDRAEAVAGHRFDGKSVVIIGDTPFDISCGEHLGVRTIAVATGTYRREALVNCGPDHLFDDLADTDAVWQAIFG